MVNNDLECARQHPSKSVKQSGVWYIYIYTYMYIYIYIYIYRERERHTHTYLYIYIYTLSVPDSTRPKASNDSQSGLWYILVTFTISSASASHASIPGTKLSVNSPLLGRNGGSA